MNKLELAKEAAARRDQGMERAARHRKYLIKHAQLAFLRVIRCSPDRTATLDDATANLKARFPDGGKWRGSVTRGLAGLIERAGVTYSLRPSNHRSLVTVWRGCDDDRID